jgi:hypothetical protein
MYIRCIFGTAELEQGNLGQIATTLVFLAHTASVHGVMVKEMDPELRVRVESVIVESMNSIDQAGLASPSNAANTASSETATTSWWQALLIKFGLGSWIAKLDPAALKAYFAELQQQVKDKQTEAQKSLEDSRNQLSGRFTAQVDELKAQVEAVKVGLGERRTSAEKAVLEKVASLKAAIPDSVKEKMPESIKSKLV